jgi:hypothetical protein
MSNQFDSRFEPLRGQSPPVPFAPAAAVRRRGRQRAHRQAVSVGVAVLAVAGLGGGGLAVATGLPGPGPVVPTGPALTGPALTGPALTGSPVPPSPTTPAVTAIPAEWLLTQDDLAGEGWVETTHELFDSDPPWYWGSVCEALGIEDNSSSLRQRLDLETASWVNDERPVRLRVDQVVELFERPEVAATNLDDVRRVLDRCSWTPSPGADQAGTGFHILAEDLAGDESMLVEVRHYFFEGETIAPEPLLGFVAVIRVSGTVTTLISEDQQMVRDLARVAAGRLG